MTPQEILVAISSLTIDQVDELVFRWNEGMLDEWDAPLFVDEYGFGGLEIRIAAKAAMA